MMETNLDATSAAPSRASGSQNNDRSIYCARKPGCAGFVAVTVDDSHESPRAAKEVAKDISDWIKSGYEIAGKFTRAEAVAGMQEFIEEKERGGPLEQPLPLLCASATTPEDERRAYDAAMAAKP